MAMLRYLVLVERDEAGYSVIIPDFSGAGTSGDTLEDALARAEDNLAVHIDGLVQGKMEIPEPRSLDALKADPELHDHEHGLLDQKQFVESQRQRLFSQAH